MLPSPSLGPPLLSLSRSPAVGPWGIPDDAAAGVEVFAGVDVVAAEVVAGEPPYGRGAAEAAPPVEDVEEPELPHAARASESATRATAPVARQRVEGEVGVVLIAVLQFCGGPHEDACPGRSFPAA